MKTGRIFAVVAIVVGTASCEAPPTAKDQAEASGSAGLLFTHEGIKIYRFHDAGRYHYFAVDTTGRPAEAITSWEEQLPCGDDCVTTVSLSDGIGTGGFAVKQPLRSMPKKMPKALGTNRP
jgi:hypothetical protein